MMDILEVTNLTKTYGKGDTAVHALDHVSFRVKKGEFVHIIGASGSGKSTLLHLLGGVDRPTEGKVFIDGKDIYTLNESSLAIFRRRNVGIIYQFYNLIPTLTAEENISLAASAGRAETGCREACCNSGHHRLDSSEKPSAERTVRRTAAAGFGRKSADERPGNPSCRRTDRQS